MKTTRGATSAILVLGDTRREALLTHIRTMLQKWAERWGAADVVAQAQLTLFYRNESAGDEVQGGATLAIARAAEHDSDLTVGVRCHASIIDAILRLPKDASTFDSTLREDSIGAGLHEALVSSLLECCVADVENVKWRIEPMVRGAAPQSAESKGHWYVGANFFGRTTPELLIKLSSNVVARLLPHGAPAGGLAKRGSAIATEKIRLQAILGETSVSIGDLASLSVDDVLVIDSNAASAGYLVNAGGARVATVALGRSGTKRAVQIMALVNRR